MSKLWVYGCSFASGHGVLGSDHDNMLQDKYGYIQIPEGCFGKFCADELGMELQLQAVSGTSNFNILDSLYQDVESMDNDDIVIIMWTYPDRTLFYDEQDRPHHCIATLADSGLSKTYYEEIYSERRSKTETTSLILAANQLLIGRGIKIINTTFWQTQVHGLAWFFNRKLLRESNIRFPECMLYRTITNNETFACYDGYHPSLETHKEYGLRLAKYIREKYEQD